MTSAVPIRIADRLVGPGQPVLIVAEVGVNHNGDPAIAHRMIDAAADCGADCVKFQTFSAEEFVNSADEFYEYESQGKWVRESQLEMFKRLELKRDELAGLFEHARHRGLLSMSTPTDRPAVDLLVRLGVPALKVGSDDMVYTPFLRYAARQGLPMIVSTGMADAGDVERAVATVLDEGNDQLMVLHCVSEYPTPDDSVNLRKITALQAQYPLPIGFSDHSNGVTACLGAVALGACMLEKHFTLDRAMPGPDHRFSADPAELAALVAEVRRLERNLGSPRLRPTEAERTMRVIARRSIVAARDLPAGHIITEDDLAFRRPGSGLMPYELDKVLGRRTRAPLPARAILSLLDLDEVTQ